jgi:hypothetical protein
MNVRRFVLRLAVACVTFIIGFAAAALFAAPRHAQFVETRATRLVIVRDFNDDALAPRFERAPCGSFRMRHAFGWSDARDFDFDAPLPPPPMPRHSEP